MSHEYNVTTQNNSKILILPQRCTEDVKLLLEFIEQKCFDEKVLNIEAAMYILKSSIIYIFIFILSILLAKLLLLYPEIGII